MTVGGGFVPEQNQASMEANVQFIQRFLKEKVPAPWSHQIFFSDGDDAAADVQIVSDSQDESGPVTELLGSLHRRGGTNSKPVTYRDHRIKNFSGASDPSLIRAAIERLGNRSKSGDRVFIYVTAHGKAGPRNEPFNTSIACWKNRSITAQQFASWLKAFPKDVPIYLVMAQCYAGGFANTIFDDVSKQDALSDRSIVGFFAQQHNLQAAGCRPDIEHDQEFSSYFWGAIYGATRNGESITNADVNQDGRVSFDEAFAHAVIASETIDIPLCTSDVLLRAFSEIPGYTLTRDRRGRSAFLSSSEDGYTESHDVASSTLQDWGNRAEPTRQRIVLQLCSQLSIDPTVSFESLVNQYSKLEADRKANPIRDRRRISSGRRELLAEVTEKWPELGERTWVDSPLLERSKQKELFSEIEHLPSYALFERRRQERESLSMQSQQQERKSVMLRRMIETLETIMLESFLDRFADAETIKKFQLMRQLERSGWSR